MIVNNPLRGDRAAGKRARQLITDFFKETKRARKSSSVSEVTTRDSIDTTMTEAQKRSLATTHEDPQIVPVPKRIALGTPDYLTVRLKYHEQGKLASTTTGSKFGFASYRLNSVYEPPVVAVGTAHQPNNYDKWTNLYKYYRVLRAKVLLTCHNQSSTLPILAACHITHDKDYSLANATTKSVVAEMKHCEVQPVGTRDGGNGMVVFTRDIYPGEYQPDISNIIGATSSGDGKFSLWTSTNGSPVIPLYLIFGHADWTTDTAVDAAWSIDIEYTVQFREWDTSLEAMQD